MKITQRATQSLKPYGNNSRTHSPEQVKQIAASIKEFGFNVPILVDGTGQIIAGHGRLMAANQLGLKKVPCIEIKHLTEAQRRAFIIADNKLATNAGWNEKLLTEELGWLKGEGFKLDLTGFDQKELQAILGKTVPMTDEDAVPEPPAKPVTKLGDIWLLGQHRVMCGDSTDKAHVARLMGGKKADLTFTSPPYNANTKVGDGDIFNGKKSKKLYGEGYSDNKTSNDYLAFVKKALENSFLSTNGFIFWNVSYNANARFEYIQQISEFLPHLIEQICWKKSSTIPFKGSLMRDWEPIYIFSTTKGLSLGITDVVSNHWEINNTNSQTESHKACFPVALPKKGMGLVKITSGIVYDPFLGSGTTVIAAETEGRVCYGMELSPAYVDVIVARWEQFTGKKAIRG